MKIINTNSKEILKDKSVIIKEVIIIIFISILAALVFNYVNEQQIAILYHPYKFDNDKQLTVAQIKKIHKHKEVLFIDARTEDEYKSGHIPDAINIPADMGRSAKMEMLSKIPKDLHVIVYCENAQCNMAERLAKEMQYLKYTSVTVFKGGWEEWNSENN
ncbi:MAG: rhodanese-like domain-containing protein [Calditrichaceae bacterium]